jgi:hypothetical protein
MYSAAQDRRGRRGSVQWPGQSVLHTRARRLKKSFEVKLRQSKLAWLAGNR